MASNGETKMIESLNIAIVAAMRLEVMMDWSIPSLASTCGITRCTGHRNFDNKTDLSLLNNQ